MRLRNVLLAVCTVVPALTHPAYAGSVEDAFRGYLDRLKSLGQEARARGDVRDVSKPTLAKRVDKLPLGRAEYAVFVTPGCRRCDTAVQAMRRRGVTFDVLDLSRSDTARESFALTKAKGVPAVMVGPYLLTGWDEKLFEKAIKLEFQEKTQSMQGEGA
jgi:glutaredoxin